ncbi:hypothetical protein EBR66_06795 [bacterium]|nr:hypothetical protein [bacterium]
MEPAIPSKRAAKAKKIKRKNKSPPIHEWPSTSSVPYSSIVGKKSWLLLQADNWIINYYILQISSERMNYIQLVQYLRAEIQNQKKGILLSEKFFIAKGMEQKFLSSVIHHVKKNYTLVQRFRILLHRWLGRRMKLGNTEDLVTGDIPKNPILLRDWSQRRIYTFEPTTILRDMLVRLRSQSYLFPKYLMPRNPYTNCELTENQFFCIMNQLRLAGYSHWMLEGLMSTNYIKLLFIERFGGTIKKDIILREFQKPGADTLELIHTFIEDYYRDTNTPFDTHIYTWAIAHRQNHVLLKKWITLCRDYYMIVFTDGNGKHYAKERDRIDIEAKRLCASGKYIRRMYLSIHPDYRPILYASVFIVASPVVYELEESASPELTLDGFWPDDSSDGEEVPSADVHGTYD